MARRKSNSRKVQPAVKSLFFEVPAYAESNPVPGVSYIDLSQCASLVNRRFYRQGLNWAVAGMKIHTEPNSQGTVTFSKAQDTWIVSNAWHKGFAMYNRMNNQVLDNLPSIKGKYHDFKVALDTDHINAGSPVFDNNLLPFTEASDGSRTDYAYDTTAEWERSLIEIPNDTAPGTTVGYALKIHGADTGSSKSLVQGYALSRSTPFSPDPANQSIGSVPTSWMNEVMNVGDNTEEIAINLMNINDKLPYPQDHYPGGDTQAPDAQVHSIQKVSGTTVGGFTSVPGGNFQCGLIKINNLVKDTSTNAPVSFVLELQLVPGMHRGYLCEKMQDV